ncbi:MAG: glycosyltransferase family A protein [Wenzhouxiangellaceae bacterium]|nr:glycosyltransferase family A protein [Wenzhouxiangellaceae bacterium]
MSIESGNNNKAFVGQSTKTPEHLLTIAIPNYNYSSYIERAIESVLAQDYADIELIVVDDASDDDSVRAAERALAGQDRLHHAELVRFDRNQGKLAALNTAIEQARGRYFIILDADDWLATHYASRCIRELRHRREKNEAIGFVYSDCKLMDATGNYIDRGCSTPFDRDLVGRLSFLPEPALTLTEAIRQAAPFDARIRQATKHHKWCRIVANGWIGHYINEPLFYYRMHDENMSGIGKRVMAEADSGSRGERILSGYWQVSGK